MFFHGKRHPRGMGADEVRAFLSHMVVSCNVAASTQNQALNALVFLYRELLKQPFAELENVVRAKKPQRLPVVLTREDEQRHPLDESRVQKAIKRSVRCAGIDKPASCHTLRHYAEIGIDVIHSQPTCWNAGRIFGPFKNNWGIAT